MGAEGRSKMSSGGESPDADTFGRNFELGRVRTNVAHGALRIVDLNRMMVRRVTILHNEGGDAQIVEPIGHLPAFMIHREEGVGATGKYQNSSTGVAPLRKVNCDFWIVAICRSSRAGSTVGPKRNRRG